jgi:hypothetical protein
MVRHTISATTLIHAPAANVYDIIVDYHHTHPRILPKPPFVSLVVEQGGTGAGTVIRCQMRVLGRLQTFRAAITEPEPGCVLVETTNDGTTTTFTVEPSEHGQHAHVTITTEVSVRDGIVGKIERWLTTRLLRPTYEKELAQLAAVVANPAP